MKKKILFINGHLNTGGVEKSLLDILKHLDYNRYDVDLLLLEGLGDYASELPGQVHLKLHCLKNTYGSFIYSLRQCIAKRDYLCFWIRILFFCKKVFGNNVYKPMSRALLGHIHYDCVIGFRRGICADLAAYGVDAAKRIVWWHHGMLPQDIKERRDFFLMSQKLDQVVSVSGSCAEMLESELGIDKSKISVICNMVDTADINKKASAFSPYDSNGKTVIVSVGRIAPEKHFENVIFAAEYLIANQLRSFEWHIVGGDWDYDKICHLVREHHLEQYVIMEGNQTNPYPYIKNADLFVHPSYVESQGLTVLEAMALRVPCVVTKSLGPCEFIEDGVNGVLTEKSPESLSERVLEILVSPELLGQVRANTHCPEQFEPENVMRKIYYLLEKS